MEHGLESADQHHNTHRLTDRHPHTTVIGSVGHFTSVNKPAVAAMFVCCFWLKVLVICCIKVRISVVFWFRVEVRVRVGIGVYGYG